MSWLLIFACLFGGWIWWFFVHGRTVVSRKTYALGRLAHLMNVVHLWRWGKQLTLETSWSLEERKQGMKTLRKLLDKNMALFHGKPTKDVAKAGKSRVILDVDNVPMRDGATQPMRFIYRSGEGVQRARANAKDKSKCANVFVWIHGGGMCVGDYRDHTPFLRSLSKAFGAKATDREMVIVSMEYRLAPEFSCPKQLEDVLDGLKWLAGNGLPWGVNMEDAASVVIGGESAGGQLALGVALTKIRGEGRGNNSHKASKDDFVVPRLTGLYLNVPAVGPCDDPAFRKPTSSFHRFGDDEFLLSSTWIDAFVDCTLDSTREQRTAQFGPDSSRINEKYRLYAPLYCDDSELQLLPPMLFHIAALDPLLDTQQAFIDRVRDNAKVTVFPHAIHGGLAVIGALLADVKQQVVGQIVEFCHA